MEHPSRIVENLGMHNAHACYPYKKCPTVCMMYGHPQRSSFRKNATNFCPSLPAEYVAAFSRQTEVPKVRCDLTDRQTDRRTDTATTVTLAAHARRGLICQGAQCNTSYRPLYSAADGSSLAIED